MTLLRSVLTAFSMFSSLPTPPMEWKEENRQFTLAAFPLVGCVAAALLAAWFSLSRLLEFGDALFAAGMTLLPIALSGGIHLDGFCDTVDALASRGSQEKKRQILKDPHTGAFAVIFVCAYLLAVFALYTELPREREPLLLACLIPIFSRIVSGLASVSFPGFGETGLLAAFRNSSRKTAVLLILCVFCAALGACALLLNARAGAAMLGAALLCGVSVYFTSQKRFGGMSGDLAGYLLQISECAMLAALVFVWKVTQV